MHLPEVQIISCVLSALLMVLVLYITIWKRQKYLWKDGIHLQDLSTSILSKNFIEFVNNYLFSNSHDRFSLNESHQTNDFDSGIDGSINLRKAYQNSPLIGYIIINSLREKIISLIEFLSKAPIDLLCADETKLMPVSQIISSKCQGINSHHLDAAEILKEGESNLSSRGFIVNKWKNMRPKMLKLYVSN